VAQCGGEGVIECGEAGGDGRAECGEGADELLLGVVVLVEEGDGVKVVLLLRFMLVIVVVLFGCLLFGWSRVISTVGGEIECVEKSVGRNSRSCSRRCR